MGYPPSILLAIVAGFGLAITALGIQSLDVPAWTVVDDNDNLCMLMALNATLHVQQLNRSVFDIPVPQSAIAEPVSGTCGSNSTQFTLNWPGGFVYPQHKIDIRFQVHGSSYKLEEVNVTEYISASVTNIWRSVSSDYPSATIGNSMTCHDFEVKQLTFHYYKFQPFAQQSGRVFGKGEECYFGIRLGLTIVLVFSLLICVAVVIAAVVISVRRIPKRRAYMKV